MTKSDAERIAILETEVAHTREEIKKMSEKLDDLLALRNKGVGAFWLASTLIGTGVIGVLSIIIGWFKH